MKGNFSKINPNSKNSLIITLQAVQLPDSVKKRIWRQKATQSDNLGYQKEKGAWMAQW